MVDSLQGLRKRNAPFECLEEDDIRVFKRVRISILLPSHPDISGERQFSNIYGRGQMVWLKRARGLQGPYLIDAVNSDGTYRLTQDGKLFKDSAQEEDLWAT